MVEYSCNPENARTRAISNALEEWQASVESARLPADARADDAGLSDAELQRLRALGYVE